MGGCTWWPCQALLPSRASMAPKPPQHPPPAHCHSLGPRRLSGCVLRTTGPSSLTGISEALATMAWGKIGL